MILLDNPPGGFNLFDSSPVISNCRVESSGNYGIYIWGYTGAPRITECTFVNNDWYAIESVNSTPSIANCLMAGNGGPYGGGGIYLEESNASVFNCTIVANLADSAGGGIRSYLGAPRITNCIVRGNTPDEITGTKPIVSYCNVDGGYEGAGNIDIDASFADPDNGDFHLMPGSPCIDAGDTTALPDYMTGDLDGNARPVDDPDTPDTGTGYPCVDMGAYEFQGESPCPEDITGNGTVNIDDLFAILGAWGTCDDCPEDVNNDDKVNIDDVFAVLGAWGPC